MRINYAIVFVTDMNRSVAFYRDVVGLPLRFESPHWTEFATEGSTLALHVTPTANPHAGEKDLEPAGHCRTGFQVADLDAFHARMLEHGVTCLEEPRPVFGVRIALYADPDWMPLAVSEAPRAQGTRTG